MGKRHLPTLRSPAGSKRPMIDHATDFKLDDLAGSNYLNSIMRLTGALISRYSCFERKLMRAKSGLP